MAEEPIIRGANAEPQVATKTPPAPAVPVPDTQEAINASTMTDLLEGGAEIRVLKSGDMVEGTMISVGKNEVYIDLEGYGVGVVRGRELYDDQATLASLKPGDKIFASVVEVENKDGNVELSLRQAGQERVWQTLREKMETREVINTKILAANKGGLMVEINNVVGFLPVSQLSLEHYPRVEEGDKSRILSVLNTYVNEIFHVQIITADSNEEKLIVSEKAVFEKETEDNFENSTPFFTSAAPLLRLICAHLECPDIVVGLVSTDHYLEQR